MTRPWDRDTVYDAVDAERDRQAEKWNQPHAWGVGDCSSSAVPGTVKVAVLAEEIGEVSRAVLDGNPVDLKTELVQVAAVAIAWLEGIAAHGRGLGAPVLPPARGTSMTHDGDRDG